GRDRAIVAQLGGGVLAADGDRGERVRAVGGAEDLREGHAGGGGPVGAVDPGDVVREALGQRVESAHDGGGELRVVDGGARRGVDQQQHIAAVVAAEGAVADLG